MQGGYTLKTQVECHTMGPDRRRPAFWRFRPWSGRLPAAPDPLSLLEVSFLTRILATEAMACIEVATASMLPSIRQRSPPKRRLRLTIINSRWSMMAGSAGAQQVP